MALRIPDSERGPLSKLLQMTAAELEALQDALSVMPPRLRADKLAADIGPRLSIEPARLREVVQSLIALYWVRDTQKLSPADFASSLAEAIEAEKDERLVAPTSGWPAFKEALTRLLALRSLGVTAKGLYLAYQYPRHVHRSRILTDARPVFLDAVDDGPAAFVINHTLQITVHEEGDDLEWFACLNAEDLEQLKDAVERALNKQKSLKALLTRTEVAVLDWED
jgi:hypothetical protein